MMNRIRPQHGDFRSLALEIVATAHRRASHINQPLANHLHASMHFKPPPAGLEPAIFGLEVRRLVH